MNPSTGLVLRHGKFYRGSELVPLEFGNIEQITLIRKQEELLNAMNGDGLVLDVWVDEITTYEVKTDFKCISCGKAVFIERESDDEPSKDELIGIHSCFHCKAKYEIGKNVEGDYIVKSKKK